MSENTNLVEYYKDLLIMQYADKVKANETVESLAKALMIFDVAAQVRDGYDVETAVGVQQDVLGKYLGAPRVITGTTFTRSYFGFMEYGDTAPFTFYPMLKYGQEAPDAQFRNYTESTQSLFALTDEEYRIIQKLAIVRNNSNASVKDIDDILFQLFGAECYFIDRMNMTVVSYMVGEKWSRLFNIAKSSGLLPNPAAVGTGLIVVPDINNIFSFSLYGGDAPAFAVGFIFYSNNSFFFPIGGTSRTWVSLVSDIDNNIWAIAYSGESGIYKCVSGETEFNPVFTGAPVPLVYMCSDFEGNIWAVGNSGYIYKCNYGEMVFTPFISAPLVTFSGITSDPSGNIYLSTAVDKVKKIAYGTSTLVDTDSDNLVWRAIVSDKDGNIWASTDGGDIYKSVVGTDEFIAVGAASEYWYSLCADKDGNIWAGPESGSIYKCDSGTTSFVSLGTESKFWSSITADPSGNIWATAYGGDIYVCEYGETTFVKVDSVDSNWRTSCSDKNGNIWAAILGGDIYKREFPETTGCMATYP